MRRKIYMLLSLLTLFATPAFAATPYPAPEFTDVETWLNSEPLTLAKLRGKVVLIDFWTYSCINCIRTLPYITQWDRTYRDKGLVVIGVHAPEFRFEQNIDNIKHALVKYNITYPVVVDNQMQTWNAFKNKYWPAHYLIDKEGRVVYTHFGEGHYMETENTIRALLGMDAKTENAPEAAVVGAGQTPETYLGFARAERFAGPEKLSTDTTQFTFPQTLTAHQWGLSGSWQIEGEHITAKEAGAKLRMNFTAGKVFLVLGTHDGNPVKARLTLNGESLGKLAGKDTSDGTLTVSQHALYELVKQDSAKNGVLEITATSPGLEAYAFTFGN